MIVAFLDEKGLARTRELEGLGVSREYVRRLCDRGAIERVARGLHTLPDAEITENHTLAAAAKLVPGGVVCLVSALRFHGLTTQAPFEVWMAIDRRAWRPQPSGVPLRIFRFSGPALNEGVKEHQIEGVSVRIYSPAKTVADCFKFRNKVGLDVAIEALRDCRRERCCSMDDLWRYGHICRVSNVIRPYLEAIA